MVADHEIFSRPFKVELTTIQVEVPDNYRTYYDGKDLPETIEGWLVHEDYEKDGWGLVSDPYGFEDSPDCEYISSGTNSKSVRSVALGRQGNWFLWGFFAPPGDMTDEARLVFLNTVVYMEQFDGQRAYGEAGGRGREWALSYAHWLDDENLRSYAAGRFDPELLAATDSSGVMLIELLKENIDYIYQDSEGRWAIDEDARGLMIPNRSVELLELCIDMLGEDGSLEMARRLLNRYTKIGFIDQRQWRSWFRQNRSKLYFTDTGGFRFTTMPY